MSSDNVSNWSSSMRKRIIICGVQRSPAYWDDLDKGVLQHVTRFIRLKRALLYHIWMPTMSTYSQSLLSQVQNLQISVVSSCQWSSGSQLITSALSVCSISKVYLSPQRYFTATNSLYFSNQPNIICEPSPHLNDFGLRWSIDEGLWLSLDTRGRSAVDMAEEVLPCNRILRTGKISSVYWHSTGTYP